ncbi:hypothetical protein K6V78_02925 [Streptococcus gallolyticus]|nr:hypothetical protein [Streptococcus gallolyticus]MBY5040594.1 hypothetical protein [Streptococcus gallolyticus]
MISCKSVIGTAVIEIEKGVGLGEIHQVVVDKGVMLTFVVKSRHEDPSHALMIGNNIYGIGNFAATVKNSDALQAITQEELQLLVDKQGVIIDEIVITVDGNKIGRVTDYFIDNENEIGFLLVDPENDGEVFQIPKSQILMIGKEYIILNEECNTLEASTESTMIDFSVKPRPALEKVDHQHEADVSQKVEPVTESTSNDTPAPKKETNSWIPEMDTKIVNDQKFDLDTMLANLKISEDFSDLNSSMKTEESMQKEIPEIESMAIESTSLKQLKEGEETAESPKQSLEDIFASFSNNDTPKEVQGKREEFQIPVEYETITEPVIHHQVVPMPVTNDETKSYVDNQKRLLLGKKLQKNLLNSDGSVLLYAGEVVTEEMIDLLRRIDRRLLVRLAGSVG